MHPFLCAGGLLLALAAAVTSTAAPLAPPRVDADIVVDSQLGDPAWANASVVDLPYETSPGDNLPASVKTTVRIAYTRDALLVSFLAQDPEPGRIRAFLRDRDALYSDDFVGIQLDTFDDQRRAYEFFVNPLGVQADLVKEEASGQEDDSWDGLWTSAGRITERGYEVEMRIPFATLRFKDTAEARQWGVRFLRIRPRNHRFTYSSERIERGARCDLCAMGKMVGLTDVRQGRNLEITPTLTFATSQQRSDVGEPWRGNGSKVSPGLDVTWAPSPNLTVNGTLNPDFSQVESDQAQLDLNTSFALFFPEKRPFFLEGADYFNTPFNVLYTRQIADPDIGLRVTGREGKQAYGVIVARDAVTQLLVPGVLGSSLLMLDQPSDVLVGRYRYDLSGQASLGAITTLRDGDDYHNALAGFDGRWQQGSHTLSGQWLHSDSAYPTSLRLADSAPAGDALQVRYGYGDRKWNGNLMHTRIDPGFRADLGFISQVGYRKSVIGGGRAWYGKQGAAVSKISVNGDWDITHRDDGQLLEREVEAYVNFNGPRQSHVQAGGGTRVRFWNDQLFDETFHTLYSEIRALPNLKLSLFYRGGDQLDLGASRMGTISNWQPSLSLDIGRGINLNVEYTTQTLRRDGGTAFDATVLDGRVGWQLDPRQRLRLSVQGSQVERNQALYARPVTARARDVAAQLLYSYRLNPRSAVYAGYSHGAFADDRIDLFDSSRSVFLKLSYAWQPQF